MLSRFLEVPFLLGPALHDRLRDGLWSVGNRLDIGVAFGHRHFLLLCYRGSRRLPPFEIVFCIIGTAMNRPTCVTRSAKQVNTPMSTPTCWRVPLNACTSPGWVPPPFTCDCRTQHERQHGKYRLHGQLRNDPLATMMHHSPPRAFCYLYTKSELWDGFFRAGFVCSDLRPRPA